MTEALFLRRQLNSILLPKNSMSILNNLFIILAASIALAASAKISIIMQPVPITLQTFALLFIAMVYGWRIGAATVALYLLEGALGLPVFAPSNPGLAAFFGPTAGYLFGFFPAAVITGLLIEKGWGAHRITVALAAIIGMTVIYGYGLFWFAKFVGFTSAINLGLKPFLVVDSIKVLALTLLVPLFWRRQT